MGLDPNVLNKISIAMRAGKGLVADFFTSIYAMITVPALYITYKLFEVLRDHGVIIQFKNTLETQLNSMIYIANNCFDNILELQKFLACISSAS